MPTPTESRTIDIQVHSRLDQSQSYHLPNVKTDLLHDNKVQPFEAGNECDLEQILLLKWENKTGMAQSIFKFLQN